MIFGLFGGAKKRIVEMITAARAGDTDKVKQLLSKGVDINASEPESGDTALLAAIDKSQWATVEYLLTQRPDLTRKDNNENSPLYLTVSRGDSAVDMVNRLLDAGAPVDLGPNSGNNAGATPLHICCAIGANACLEVLLARGASAKHQTPSGSMPLHTAAIGGDQRTVELLCKVGASVNALNNEKRTPLHNCGITGNSKVAAALIQHGAAVDEADDEGCTPLMRAVMKNHSEVAKVLLDHGANPDVVVETDDAPLYPLFIAAMNGYDDVVRALIDKGVNVTAKVPGSPSPVDAAKHNGHEAAAKMISAAIRKKKAAETKSSTVESKTEAGDESGQSDQEPAGRSRRSNAAVELGVICDSLRYDEHEHGKQLSKIFSKSRAEWVKSKNDPASPQYAKACKLLGEWFTVKYYRGRMGFSMSFGLNDDNEINSLTEVDAVKDPSEAVDRAFADEPRLKSFDVVSVDFRIHTSNHPLRDKEELGFSPEISAVAVYQVKPGRELGTPQALQDFLGNVGGLLTSCFSVQIKDEAIQTVEVDADGDEYTSTSSSYSGGEVELEVNLLAAKDFRDQLAQKVREANNSPSLLGDAVPEPKRVLMLGDEDRLQCLLDEGLPVDTKVDDETLLKLALMLATTAGMWFEHEELSGFLLSRFSTAEDYGAALKRMALDLLGRGADVNVTGGAMPVLALAEALNDPDILEICRSRSNSVDDVHSTPLLLAAERGDVTSLRTLLDRGARINKRYLETGVAPLMMASQGPDGEDSPPLSGEQLASQEAAVRLLIERGARIDARSDRGDTAIGNAVRRGNASIVQILLDAGAKTTDALPKGQDLRELARERGHKLVLEVLRDPPPEKRAAVTTALAPSRAAAALWKKVAQAITHQDIEGLSKHAESRKFADLAPDQRLLVWAVLGDATQVQAALTEGANPNQQFDDVLDGLGALYAAVGLSRDLATVSCLLDAGADPNLPWSNGATPIFEATADHFLDFTRLLIGKGANADVRLTDGRTPLLQAAEGGHVKCVDMLLDAGADINAVSDENGVGAFGAALNRLDMSLAEHLLTRGAEPNFGSIETLPLAVAEHGSLALILAIEAGGGSIVPPEMRGRVAFVAARNKDGEVFDHVLSRGADINEGNDFNYTPLTLATLNNHETLVGRYLDRGDDADALDIDQDSALSLAIEYERPGIVRLLQQHGAQQSVHQGLSGEESMLRAAEEGALGTVLDLRDAGVSINVQDAEGNSPLMLATKGGHHGVVRSLYHLGADINHRNLAGESATAIATALDRQDLLATMKEFVADDAVPESMRSLTVPLGGIYDLGNTMFGRLSHPGKSKPPYDNSGSDAEDESDEEDESDGDEHEDVDEADEADEPGEDEGEEDEAKTIREKLQLLGRALASDSFKSQVSEQTQEHLDGKLNHWIELNDESGLGEVEIKELNRLLAGLGLGEKGEEAEEQETSPLFVAVRQKDIAAVKKLVKAGVDVDEPDGEGNTALIAAVLAGEEELVDALLKLGADVNKARPDGLAPLYLAVLRGSESICKSLLDSGALVDAASVRSINGQGVAGCTPLYEASLAGNLGMCRLLLGMGASVDAANDTGYTPLMWALQQGHDEVVRLLLDSGASADPDTKFKTTLRGLVPAATPVYIAAVKGNLSMVKMLIMRGADLNRRAGNGWTPLKSAARSRRTEIVQALLEAKADPNIADGSNWTPLGNAVENDDEAIVTLLLKHGAALDIQTVETEDEDSGRTALMNAAVSGNLPITRALLKYGANPNILNAKGRTALHSAMVSGSLEMVSLLLNSGADVNVYGNAEGRQSALDLALQRWMSQDREDDEDIPDVLKFLLEKGMPDDRSSLEETALDLLLDGHIEVLEILKNHGFSVNLQHPKMLAFLNSAESNSSDDESEDDEEPDDDPSSDNPTEASKSHALITAVNLGFPKLVEQALTAGADVNEIDAFGTTALLTALFKFSSSKMSRRHQRDTDQIIDLLLRRGADPDKGRVPPLWVAVRGGRVHLVNAMIVAGVSLDQVIDIPRVDEPGSTQRVNALFMAIGIAASEGSAMNERMAVSLVRAGIDLSVVSDGGLAIHQASSNGMAETLQAILKREPAMVDSLDDAGATALMLAATSNRPRSVAALLAGGADRTIKDPSGMTAADHATGHSDLLEQLA